MLGQRPDLCDVVELLTSELVTNAVLHAAGQEILVSVTVANAADDHRPGQRCVRVEVSDGEGDAPPVVRHRPDGEGGRGLALVQQLSTAWGTRRDGDGKVVWFEMDTGAP